MDDLVLGRVLLRTPLSADVKGINLTWSGIVGTASGQLGAFLKALPSRELMVECLCALLGRAVGLPIPRPIVAADDELGILFGAEQVPHPDLRHTALPSTIWEEHLAAWKTLPRASAFDGWIANRDRHWGNLLTDGTGEFWLIDHGLALPPGLAPDAAVQNLLLQVLKATVTDDLKRRRALNGLSTAVESFDSGTAAACGAQLPGCPPELLAFLEQRYPHLWRLLRTEMTDNHELPGV
jgi:hypothetical protein